MKKWLRYLYINIQIYEKIYIINSILLYVYNIRRKWKNHLRPMKLKWKNEKKNYLKLTEACQTKAKRKKKTGIIGITSTIGSKIA